MSASEEIDFNLLYGTLLRETENDTIQEVSSNLYISISDFIGKLKSEDYDGFEAKVKNELVNLMATMISLLLKIRLAKAMGSSNNEISNLLEVEKFIVDAKKEMSERQDMIISATLNGKSKLLESISQNHKTETVVVRFLKEMDQIVGSDLKKYGPFKAEDVASIPNENAQALILQKIATKIRWQD